MTKLNHKWGKDSWKRSKSVIGENRKNRRRDALGSIEEWSLRVGAEPEYQSSKKLEVEVQFLTTLLSIARAPWHATYRMSFSTRASVKKFLLLI